MKRITKLCIKIFFWSLVLTSVIYFLLQRRAEIQETVFFAIPVAIGVTILFYIFYRWGFARKTFDQEFDATVTHEFEFFLSDVPVEEIKHRLEEAARERSWKFTRNNGNIQMKTRVNIRSFGEKIKVDLEERNKEVGKVVIESRPRLRLIFFDLGINDDNVSYIKRLIL